MSHKFPPFEFTPHTIMAWLFVAREEYWEPVQFYQFYHSISFSSRFNFLLFCYNVLVICVTLCLFASVRSSWAFYCISTNLRCQPFRHVGLSGLLTEKSVYVGLETEFGQLISSGKARGILTNCLARGERPRLQVLSTKVEDLLISNWTAIKIYDEAINGQKKKKFL